MSNQNIGSLSGLRERWTDQVISIVTVVVILMLFVFAPLKAVGIPAFQMLEFVSALVLIGGVFLISAGPIVTAAMLAAFVTAIWAAFARLTAPSALDIYLLAGARLAMSVVLIFAVGRTINLLTGRLTRVRYAPTATGDVRRCNASRRGPGADVSLPALAAKSALMAPAHRV